MFKLSMLIPEQRKAWLKRSAELGLPEAQHNLAHEYKQEGDTLRQMAWLIQAAQQHFYPSILNVAKVFATGNDEIQPNPAAAFVWLETGRAIAKTPELDEIEKIATEQFLLMKIKQQEVKLPEQNQSETQDLFHGSWRGLTFSIGLKLQTYVLRAARKNQGYCRGGHKLTET